MESKPEYCDSETFDCFNWYPFGGARDVHCVRQIIKKDVGAFTAASNVNEWINGRRIRIDRLQMPGLSNARDSEMRIEILALECGPSTSFGDDENERKHSPSASALEAI